MDEFFAGQNPLQQGKNFLHSQRKCASYAPVPILAGAWYQRYSEKRTKERVLSCKWMWFTEKYFSYFSQNMHIPWSSDKPRGVYLQNEFLVGAY